MSLITSLKKKEKRMSDKVAKKDITVRNQLGQTVVIVPAGQPIPDNLDELKKKAGEVKAQDAPAENKAKRSSGRK